MAVISNNGRLINSLPVAVNLQNSDQFIVQSTNSVNPNGITQRIPYSSLKTELSNAIIDIIENDATVKFSGSFYSPDNKPANFYTVKVRNGLTVTTGGITVSSGASSFQSITATQFNGPLTGNVNAATILVSGTGNFGTIIVTNTIAGNINSSGLSTFANAQIGGGAIGGTPGAVTINNTPIGNTADSTIKGTSITASLGFKSLGILDVDTTSRFNGQVRFNTITGSNIIASRITGSKSITGSLFGKLTGDIFSPTGVKVLENGTGLTKNSYFYGSSSYALKTLTASYALATVTTNNVQFSVSSSYASSSTKASFAISSSYASSSRNATFSFSSSYASASRKSNSSFYASSSKTSLTSSYVLQTDTSFTNKLSNYNGTAISAVNDLSVVNVGIYRFLYFSGSTAPSVNLPNYYTVIDGYTPPGSPTAGQSALALSLNVNRSQRMSSGKLPSIYNYGPEAWNFLVYDSGSLALQSYKQSYAFTSSKYSIKYNVPVTSISSFNVVQFLNNDIYFWGEPTSYNTAMRDGALGIGVTAHSVGDNERKLKARLHIDVFSSSFDKRGAGAWEGTSSFVRDLPAILVRYGSGSAGVPLQKTFYVSGSGNTYIGGTAYINGAVTSSNDFYIGGNLNVVGTVKSTTTANGSTFNFLDSPVVVANTSTVTDFNTWKQYDISAYPTAKSAILYVQLAAQTIAAGNSVELEFRFRKNSSDNTKKGTSLKATSGYNTSLFQDGSQVIVPIDTSAKTFDYYVVFSGTATESYYIQLVGYLT